MTAYPDTSTADLRERAARVELLVLDVDGVLTDGRFTLDEQGSESKTFHTQDGYGMRRLVENGVQIAIITGRSSGAVTHRAQELGISFVFQGCRDKQATIVELMRDLGVKKDGCAAVGDDMPDQAMYQAAGLKIAVANAVPELKALADMVTRRCGGDGAVREVAEFILDARRDAQ
ncbi:MAG: HAD hydrolase family protein [Pseudomonadota bacterium]